MNPGRFAELHPYRLTGVTVTDQPPLGSGGFATVLELRYMGLKYAGKKLSEEVLHSRNWVTRFAEECRLLKDARHPNVVQFLGVYFQEGEEVPLLVMEFLHANLTSCIKDYVLPKNISYSMLHDVALGLCYLHSHTPPIIHRDLSSSNVLLTHNMTAKISDLGLAKVLDLPQDSSSLVPVSHDHGTFAFKAPELLDVPPKCHTSADIFAFGVIMIHLFSGTNYPDPRYQRFTKVDGVLVEISEVERRAPLLEAIGGDHPLITIIKDCIRNEYNKRPHASDVEGKLADMVEQFPPPRIIDTLASRE